MMMDIIVLVIITILWIILWTLAEEADEDEHR